MLVIVPQAACHAACPGAHWAVIRGVIVKNFPVVKDLLRSSVADLTQPESFTEKLAIHAVRGMRGACVRSGRPWPAHRDQTRPKRRRPSHASASANSLLEVPGRTWMRPPSLRGELPKKRTSAQARRRPTIA